jgi:hypothetical protein
MKSYLVYGLLSGFIIILSACGGGDSKSKPVLVSSSKMSSSTNSSQSSVSSQLSSSVSNQLSSSSSSESSLPSGNLIGKVKNFYTYSEIPNAKIRVSAVINGENKILAEAITDESGSYSVTEIPLATKITLTADASEFGEQSVIITTSNTNSFELVNDILIAPSDLSLNFDASTDAVLAVEGVDLVSIPANAFNLPNGEIFSGTVTAELTILNVASNPEIMPGNYLAINPQNQQVSTIESFGAINVVFTDPDGVKLQLRDTKKAVIRIPVQQPTNGYSIPPQTIPLYFFDEFLGYWIEEGSAELTAIGGEDFYVGEVSHFSTWNADQIMESVNIKGCVQDINGQKITGAKIVTSGLTYIGLASTFTDISGNFNVAAKKGSTLLLSAFSGSFSQYLKLDTTAIESILNECLVIEPASSTIKLTWGANPRDLDSHLIGPADNLGATFNLSFWNETVVVDGVSLWLDVDDTTSYGPEIITIPKFPLSGTYHYYVHHYDGSSDIAQSPARIELMLDGNVSVFSPPVGEVNECWHVFDIEVSSSLTATIVPVGKWLDADKCDVGDFSQSLSRQQTFSVKSQKMK